MRTKKYFLGLLALALCAACSDSEQVDNNTIETDADGNNYMSVIVSMSGTDTRATTQTYEDGTTSENYVSASNSVLLFYDTYGSYVAHGVLTADLDPSTYEDGTGYKKTSVVIYGMSVQPTHVFAVFNYSSWNSLLNKSLSEVIDITSSTTPSASGSFLMTNALRVEDGEFVRAATLNTDYIYTSQDDADSGNPAATIFVEREIAKVDVGVQTSITTASSDYEDGYIVVDDSGSYYAILDNGYGTDSDGKLTGGYTYAYLKYTTGDDGNVTSISTEYITNVKARVDILGWAINATNDEGYLSKHYDSDGESDLADMIEDEQSNWVDINTSAYLWAVDINYDNTSSAYTIGDATTDGSGSGVFEGVNYLSWNDVKDLGCSTDAAYYHENTACNSAQETYNQPGTKACTPTITLAAQLFVDTDGDGTYSADDFQSYNIYYRNGVFYSNLAVGYLAMNELENYYLSTDGGTTYISKSDGNLFAYFADAELGSATTTNDNTGRVQITSLTLQDGVTAWYSEDGSTYTQVDMDNTTSKTYQALLTAINSTTILAIDDNGGGLKCFYLGYCYYQAPIEHINYTDSEGSNVVYNGIVRNHSYHLTLNTISDVGQAVFDPDEEIVVIPGEEDTYYLSCTVNILKWVAKSQTVDF